MPGSAWVYQVFLHAQLVKGLATSVSGGGNLSGVGVQEVVVAPKAFFRMVSIVWSTAAQANHQRRRDCHVVHGLVGETDLWDDTGEDLRVSRYLSRGLLLLA